MSSHDIAHSDRQIGNHVYLFCIFLILHPTMDEDTQYTFISKQVNVLCYYQNMQYQNIELKMLV